MRVRTDRNFDTKATLDAYAKAMRAGEYGLAGDIRTANEDLITRFDLIDAAVEGEKP